MASVAVELQCRGLQPITLFIKCIFFKRLLPPELSAVVVACRSDAHCLILKSQRRMPISGHVIIETNTTRNSHICLTHTVL